MPSTNPHDFPAWPLHLCHHALEHVEHEVFRAKHIRDRYIKIITYIGDIDGRLAGRLWD